MRNQLDTFGASEFGIQIQYLDGEAHLVDDALARRLHLAPEFQILRSIVQSIAVFVVNILAVAKFAPEYLRHEYAVLKGFFSTAKMQPSVSGGMDVTLWIDRSPSAAFIPARFAAKFLAFVVACVATVFGSAQAPIFGDTTKLTLESRGWLLVHEEQLQAPLSFVKENI